MDMKLLRVHLPGVPITILSYFHVSSYDQLIGEILLRPELADFKLTAANVDIFLIRDTNKPERLITLDTIHDDDTLMLCVSKEYMNDVSLPNMVKMYNNKTYNAYEANQQRLEGLHKKYYSVQQYVLENNQFVDPPLSATGAKIILDYIHNNFVYRNRTSVLSHPYTALMPTRTRFGPVNVPSVEQARVNAAYARNWKPYNGKAQKGGRRTQRSRRRRSTRNMYRKR
jgi:hypothetical protein